MKWVCVEVSSFLPGWTELIDKRVSGLLGGCGFTAKPWKTFDIWKMTHWCMCPVIFWFPSGQWPREKTYSVICQSYSYELFTLLLFQEEKILSIETLSLLKIRKKYSHVSTEFYLWIDSLSHKFVEHISILCLGSHEPRTKCSPRFMTAMITLWEHVSPVTVHWCWFSNALPLPSYSGCLLGSSFTALKHICNWKTK